MYAEDLNMWGKLVAEEHGGFAMDQRSRIKWIVPNLVGTLTTINFARGTFSNDPNIPGCREDLIIITSKKKLLIVKVTTRYGTFSAAFVCPSRGRFLMSMVTCI